MRGGGEDMSPRRYGELQEGAVTTRVRKKLLTFEEFCILTKEEDKADLIDGVIYMASPDNTDANRLFMWLGGLIECYVEAKELGDTFGSRVAFRLGESQGPEPDIAVVLKERLHLVERGYVNGPPDLAIEIVSPESVERDYEKKRKQYQDARVPEYWIVDEVLAKVTLLSLDAQGRYREVRPRKGVLRSAVLPGFWVRLDWLWKLPRPKKVEVLAQLLAG
jgi:Uma2 family endonuclease